VYDYLLIVCFMSSYHYNLNHDVFFMCLMWKIPFSFVIALKASCTYGQQSNMQQNLKSIFIFRIIIYVKQIVPKSG